MSKHTLGPWEWRGRWLYGQGEMLLWYTTDDNGVHAKPEDARLIAAAPQMLEALQLARCFVKDGTATAELVDATIAAATGAATQEQQGHE